MLHSPQKNDTSIAQYNVARRAFTRMHNGLLYIFMWGYYNRSYLQVQADQFHLGKVLPHAWYVLTRARFSSPMLWKYVYEYVQ